MFRKFLKIPLAKKQIQEIEQQIANISTEHLVPLKKSIEELKEQIQEYEGKIDAYQREITKLQLEIENATREIPLLEKKSRQRN
jgi:peptidoglycan hydrolase CwlO-like protein